ncbi:MAG: glycosyltransferase, partial [Acidimicrobiales bacterium]|nr:glycosyltransferase [Acidimicrobiales bacterium]
LDRRQRLAVALVAAIVVDRVVVSSPQEAEALRARYRGAAARRAEVRVVPPANPSAPRAEVAERSGASGPSGRTIGVHGQYRPDKGIDWLLSVLARIDDRYDRLVIVGRGWEAAPWPRSVLDRFEVSVVGQADRAELHDWFARWDLALAPFDGPPTDGRLSLRTPLAHGVPTLTRGPRPAGLRLDAEHLLFDDEVDLRRLPELDAAAHRRGLAAVAALEAASRAELVEAMFGP